MDQNGVEATITDYMTSRITTMHSKDSVWDVATRMVDGNISSIGLTDDNGKIIGILTERDIVKLIAKKVPPSGVTASSLMSNPIVSVEKGSSIEDAARVMIQKRVRHLLVEDATNGEIVGIIAATDLVRHLRRNLADEDLIASEVWQLFI